MNKNIESINIFNVLKHISGIVLMVLLCFSFNVNAQNPSAEELKQQMAKIRQTTNWEDPVAAKKANEQIRELSKKLMMTGKTGTNLPQGLSKTEAEEMQQEGVDDKMKMWTQIMTIAREGGAWDLAKPLREEIIEKYKEDENPTVKNKDWLNEMTFLYIDMSSPTVQFVIDQMEQYKSIQILVITGGKNGALVNLENLIAKAAHYPLKQLYIINFKGFVTKIPGSINNFRNLNYLALYNNKITQLPSEISSIKQLKSLYVDMNPVNGLLRSIQSLNNLDTLGIANTLISNDEINQIKQQLPNCKILQQ